MLRKKNDERYEKEYKDKEESSLLNDSKRIHSSSPHSKGYLKKDDLLKMESIKEKIGQADQMKEIREKYKENDVTQKYINKIPLFKRIGSNPRTVMSKLQHEIEMKKEEKKLLAKPMDYESLKIHQEKIDRTLVEREHNRSLMKLKLEESQREANEQIQKSLKYLKVTSLDEERLEARMKREKMKEAADSFQKADLKVPKQLSAYKNKNNSWMTQQKRITNLLEKKFSYGQLMEDEQLKKMKEKQAARLKSASKVQDAKHTSSDAHREILSQSQVLGRYVDKAVGAGKNSKRIESSSLRISTDKGSMCK